MRRTRSSQPTHDLRSISHLHQEKIVILSFNLPALFVSLVITIVMAILGGLRTSNQLTQWFPALQKPRFQLPLWAFISVGIVVSLLDTIIAYCLRAAGDEPRQIASSNFQLWGLSCITMNCGTSSCFAGKILRWISGVSWQIILPCFFYKP